MESTLTGTLHVDQVLMAVLSLGSLLSLDGRDMILDSTYLESMLLCFTCKNHSILSLKTCPPFPEVSSLEKRK